MLNRVNAQTPMKNAQKPPWTPYQVCRFSHPSMIAVMPIRNMIPATRIGSRT